MRYPKGSVHLGSFKDKVILNFLAESRHVTRSQLMQFVRYYPDFDNRTCFLPIFGGSLRISIFLSAALFAPGVVVKTYPLDYRHGPCTMAGCFFAARVA